MKRRGRWADSPRCAVKKEMGVPAWSEGAWGTQSQQRLCAVPHHMLMRTCRGELFSKQYNQNCGVRFWSLWKCPLQEMRGRGSLYLLVRLLMQDRPQACGLRSDLLLAKEDNQSYRWKRLSSNWSYQDILQHPR